MPSMVRQDFIFDENYFTKWISYKLRRIPESVARTEQPPADPKYRAQYIFTIFITRYELLIEKYSRGDDLHELRAMLPDIVDGWEWARREELKVFDAPQMRRRHGFAVNLDAYSLALWLVSIAICLQADDALLARLVALIGNAGEDRLYERLIAHRVPGRPVATTLCWPKPYQMLYDAIDERDPADRVRLMRRFLAAWYPGMKPTYWHDNHKGVDGGGYFGYWCFEAAGVARVFGFDDAGWRDNPYYPKDLAAYSGALPG